MKPRILLFIAGGMSLLFAGGLFAQEIVDTAYVADAAKRGAVIWDVRDADACKPGHTSGTVNIGNAGDVLRDPNTEDFVATERVEKLFNDSGIDLGKEVIVYSRKGDPCA
jgi:thiosulfate/3-mercaptopyruvate sulfurtransferase